MIFPHILLILPTPPIIQTASPSKICLMFCHLPWSLSALHCSISSFPNPQLLSAFLQHWHHSSYFYFTFLQASLTKMSVSRLLNDVSPSSCGEAGQKDPSLQSWDQNPDTSKAKIETSEPKPGLHLNCLIRVGLIKKNNHYGPPLPRPQIIMFSLSLA